MSRQSAAMAIAVIMTVLAVTAPVLASSRNTVLRHSVEGSSARLGRSLLDAVDTEDSYKKKYASQNMLTYLTGDKTVLYTTPSGKTYQDGKYTVIVFPGAGNYTYINTTSTPVDTDYYGCWQKTIGNPKTTITFLARANANTNTCPLNIPLRDSQDP